MLRRTVENPWERSRSRVSAAPTSIAPQAGATVRSAAVRSEPQVQPQGTDPFSDAMGGGSPFGATATVGPGIAGGPFLSKPNPAPPGLEVAMGTPAAEHNPLIGGDPFMGQPDGMAAGQPTDVFAASPSDTARKIRESMGVKDVNPDDGDPTNDDVPFTPGTPPPGWYGGGGGVPTAAAGPFYDSWTPLGIANLRQYGLGPTDYESRLRQLMMQQGGFR